MSHSYTAKQGSGKRLYECEECHTQRMVPWGELNRAARPRCYGCGSTRLELVSPEARKDRARLNQERIVGADYPCGSLVLASGLSTRHRKVT